MIKLKINNTDEYTINNVESLNVAEYAAFEKTFATCTTPTTIIKSILTHLSDVPKMYIDCITDDSITDIDIQNILIPNFKEYKKDFDKITFGNFIDIDYYFHTGDVQRCIACITLGNGYSSDDVENYLTNNNSIAFELPKIKAFQDWQKQLYEDYSDIITKSDEATEQYNGWLPMSTELADFDLDKQELNEKKLIRQIFMLIRLKKNANDKRHTA